jgi:glycosyltransferase involved in cell wall biosynthesis
VAERVVVHSAEARLRRPSAERVYFLMANACGSGGVARTVMNLAGELARDRHVEIISVARSRHQLHYRPRTEVPITWIVDNRRREGGGRRRPSQNPQAPAALRELDSKPARFDFTDASLSALTDRRLAKVLARLEPGIVISTRPSLHAVALELAPPHVLTVGQEHLNFVTRSQTRVFDTLQKWVPRLDAFVLLTEADREDWARTLAGTGARVETIPNSLSWEIGPPAPLEEKVVVAAGRFEARKGFARLVEAYAPLAAERPDWQLHLYGLGEERDRLAGLIDSLGVGEQVRLMGYTDALREVLQKSSVYAMASHFEGLPMVLLEAMSQGLPLVSMDCPRGPAEIIEDGVNGRLVADGDLDGFRQALRQVMDDDDLRRRMGAAGLHKAEAYRVDAVADRWKQLFDELVREV